jgi:hypothetical protein
MASYSPRKSIIFEIGFKKPLPWSVSIPSRPCIDLWNGYSSELLSLWWLTDGKNRRQKASHTVSLSKLLIESWSISARSLTPQKQFSRGHWPRWNRFCRLSRQFSRRILRQMRNGFRPWIRQGPRWSWLMKKTEGRKSRVTVPLTLPHWPLPWLLCEFTLRCKQWKKYMQYLTSVMFSPLISMYLADSATWYSTHTCSTLLRFNCLNGDFI